jgi:hypothetical protein
MPNTQVSVRLTATCKRQVRTLLSVPDTMLASDVER